MTTQKKITLREAFQKLDAMPTAERQELRRTIARLDRQHQELKELAQAFPELVPDCPNYI